MDNNNGPQPQPQPQMQPPMQPPANYNLPPKKSNAGMIAGIIGGIVLLVGIIVALVLVLTMSSGPNKDDYEKASNHIAEMQSTYYGLFLVSIDETDVSKQKKAVEKYKGQAEELGKMKAITNDKEVKEIYDKVAAKMEKFINSRVSVAEEAEITTALRPPSSSYYGDRSVQYEDTARRLEAIVGNIKIEANKKFVEDAIKLSKEVAKAAKKKEKAEEAGNYSSSKEYFDLVDKHLDLSTVWRKERDKNNEDSDIRGEMVKLQSIVDKKLLDEIQN